MVPKQSGFNQSDTTPSKAHAHRDVFQARLPWEGSIFIITETQFAIQSQVM